MKYTPHIIGFVVLMVMYHAAGIHWGRDAKLWFLLGLAGVSAVLYLVLLFFSRRLRAEQPQVAAELDPHEGVPWYWDLLDNLLGTGFCFGPVVLVMLLRGQPVSLSAEFTGWHLLAMVVGGVVYWCLRTISVRRLARRG